MPDKSPIRVKLIYRNYKPLHSLYESLINFPPEGIEYVIPSANTKLRRFYKFYRRFKYLPGARFLIRASEKLFFLRKRETETDVDLYQYINMIDDNPPDKPYIVDIEYAASLISFTPDSHRIEKVKKFLMNQNCKAITCLSFAAKDSLKRLLRADYEPISHKVDVIYPAITALDNIKPNHKYILKSDSVLKLLFVGNQAYLKGLEELLEALKNLNQQIGEERLELHVISDDAAEIVERYNLANVRLYKPGFSKQEILSQFFIPADVFIMPTKEDTFGMAVLESLACATAVITTRQFALPELVSQGRDGILLELKDPILDRVAVPDKEGMRLITTSNINEELSRQIEDSLRDILDKKVDIKKMGSYGPAKFNNKNKFSVALRNQKLQSLYKAAYFSATAT